MDKITTKRVTKSYGTYEYDVFCGKVFLGSVHKLTDNPRLPWSVPYSVYLHTGKMYYPTKRDAIAALVETRNAHP